MALSLSRAKPDVHSITLLLLLLLFYVSFHSSDFFLMVYPYRAQVHYAAGGARVLLAPLRFGAGIKGKIVDAWANGLPVVTTPVGAEGMIPGVDQLWSGGGGSGGGGGTSSGSSSSSSSSSGGGDVAEGVEASAAAAATRESWGGRWRSTEAAGIARDAVALHENRVEWERARDAGLHLISDLFPAERNLAVVREAVEGLFSPVTPATTATTAEVSGDGGRSRFSPTTRLEARRSVDFFGGSLWHHSVRSTEYFSRQVWESLGASLG